MRALHALEDLEPPFKISYKFVCKEVPGKITDKCIENLSKPLETFTHRYALKIFYYNPLLCRFSLQFIFLSEQPFYGNYSTLDSHTNTVISHTFAYSSRWRRKPLQGLFTRICMESHASVTGWQKSFFSYQCF